MDVRRLTSRGALVLLALVIFSSGVFPQSKHVAASESRFSSIFGQSFVVSDFDEDGFVDEARVEGSSVRKSVGIRLSATGKKSVLHFNSTRGIPGSLLALDLDNDGATDLVWTNPFHSSDVVVWLGDGNGKFSRVDSSRYTNGFGLGQAGIDQPDESNQETAIDFESSPALEQPGSQKYLDHGALELPRCYSAQVSTLAPFIGQPTGRAPPTKLT
jgi:hypothetical protein